MSEFNQREENFFLKCLELPPDEREQFVESSCLKEPALRDGVLNLLKAYECTNGFLDELPESDFSDIASKLHQAAPPEERSGDQIGRYRLLELIGEGSWGSVWMAEQTKDIERRVALKILKIGLDAEEFFAGFDGERQVLAMMDHPNIARVLDAGTTSYGRPYLIMELVNSMPLLEYADREKLSIEERVKLFVRICNGVHHAHQKGVVHRDLKPSNILVAVYDDEAVPKIIDFGVAKTAFSRPSNQRLFFGAHTFIGTPIYSSPEQLDFTRLDVDHRSDIYSLGAMLYELLSGRPLFDPAQLADMDQEDVLRIVMNATTLEPSAKYRKTKAFLKGEIAEKRGCECSELIDRLSGEIDWIVMKCLRKNRSQRYDSASALAQDLEAFLKDEPVSAAPFSYVYHILKYMRKKRPRYALWLEIPMIILFSGALFFYIGSSPIPNPTSLSSPIVFTDQSIAVLPVRDMSKGNGYANLSGRIRDDLLIDLSKVPDLLVFDRIATLRYRDTVKSFKQIGNELGVGYLVDGSVHRTGDRFLIDIHLIDTQSGVPVWGEVYDQEIGDFFPIQHEIAQEVALHLNANLSLEEVERMNHRSTRNSEAYDSFLRARQALGEEKIDLLEKAVSLDPDFVDAWTNLGWSCILRWRYDLHRSDPSLLAEARHALDVVQRLAPDRALELKSAFVYDEQDDIEGAIGLRLEALSMGLGGGGRELALLYIQAGHLAKAQSHLDEASEEGPMSSLAMAMLHNSYTYRGMWEEARVSTQGYLEQEGGGASHRRRLIEELAQIDFLQKGDRADLVAGAQMIPGFLDEPRGKAWQALVSRDFREAIGSMRFMDTASSFELIFSSKHSSWSLSLEPLCLLTALIQFERGTETEWKDEVREAKVYLEGIIAGYPQVDPDHWASIAICYALEGDRENLDSTVPKIRELTRSVNWQYRRQVQCELKIAIAYLTLGDENAAIETLERASQVHSPIFLDRELDLWFMFDRMRGNPRFITLLNREE